MKSFLLKIIIILFLLSGTGKAASGAQLLKPKPEDKFPPAGKVSLFATSADISAGKTYIVLYWEKAKGITGYNIYRRVKGAPARRLSLLNEKHPITMVKNCDELKAIIPPGSPEWLKIANAFKAAPIREKIETQKKEASKLGKSSSELKRLVNPQLLYPGLITGTKLRPVISLDLCAVFQRGLTPEEEAIFEIMANIGLKFRLANGLAFIDEKVIPHEEYIYELRGVDKSGLEVVLGRDIITVQAGDFTLPDPPEDLTAIAGDNQVLCLWNRQPEDFSYVVMKSKHSSGSYQVVSAEPIVFDVETDLKGNNLVTPRPGFLDYQRWDDDGFPITHEVKGSFIDGPKNYESYYYRVVSHDILDRSSPLSNYVLVTPVDTTPPSAPSDLSVNASTLSSSLILNWKKSIRNINGHREQDHFHTYRIYRSDSIEELEDLNNLSTYEVMTVTSDPTDESSMDMKWEDTASILSPLYGEKDFFYRICCEDAHHNLSAPSAVISCRVPDHTPPGGTRLVSSEGFSDLIRIYWLPNPELDIAGYQVYRSVCDRGSIYPTQVLTDKITTKMLEIKLPCDYVLIGEILAEEAERILDSDGSISYEDSSAPKGSPICYSYWVRAFDMARNLYNGVNGCPKEEEFICQKLYEEIPPPVPVITRMKARDNAVLIEWTSSPVQDLRCFHIYRSSRENEIAEFVACVFSDASPTSTKPWTGVEHPRCEDIPADPDPVSVAMSFVDTTLDPNKIYWYRVSALDWLGNESSGNNILLIPAVSTFTYSCGSAPQPIVTSPSESVVSGCARLIRWNPAYDATKLTGFIVFRSTKRDGAYRQISPVVKSNRFTDNSALQGIRYWYRVQAIDLNGKLSEASQPVQY